MIIDQLIEKTSSAQARERLLLEPGDLTLNKAVRIGSHVEAALKGAQQLTKASSLARATNTAVQNVHSHGLRPCHTESSADPCAFQAPLWELWFHQAQIQSL